MRYLFFLLLALTIFRRANAQMEKRVGYYFGNASTMEVYGQKLDSAISIKVELFLNADSTYRVNWHLDVHPYCIRFDTLWSNTGKWLLDKELLYFSLDADSFALDNGYLESTMGKKDYPIASMYQDGLEYHLSKKEIKRMTRVKQKNPEFEYYLKVYEQGIIQFDIGWDCIEEIWLNNSISKTK